MLTSSFHSCPIGHAGRNEVMFSTTLTSRCCVFWGQGPSPEAVCAPVAAALGRLCWLRWKNAGRTRAGPSGAVAIAGRELPTGKLTIECMQFLPCQKR